MKRVNTPQELAQAIKRGERRALAKAISLVESSREQDRHAARELLELLGKRAQPARRLGISGTPGVGKSTFIDAFGMSAINRGNKVAVLSIDPSSERSGGSILGDKTRMPELARNDKAFIRPSPTSGNLGGVARNTRESMLLCEAAGFDLVIIETVGVGQSETSVARMVDCFILLSLANAGDELQGIKRGIMEVIDLVIVNKVDNPDDAAAKRARQQLLNALHLLQPQAQDWTIPVLLCSALHKTGLEQIWQQLDKFFDAERSNSITERRSRQSLQWFNEVLRTELLKVVLEDSGLQSQWQTKEQAVHDGLLSPHAAAEEIVEQLRVMLKHEF